MAKKKKAAKKTTAKKEKKSGKRTVTMPGKPKGDFDLEINDKSNNGYLEYDPKGKKCQIYIDVPNKVGKTLRIRQVGEEGGSVTVRTINGIGKITPKMKFLDLIKSGNVWAMLPRYS